MVYFFIQGGMNKMSEFKCDCCGLCCMNLNMSEIYSDLDRGDGVCIYFDMKTKLCSIYDKRPEKCNIDKTYERLYQGEMIREQFYQLNYEMCKLLKMKK